MLDARDYYFDFIDDINRTSLDPYAAMRNARRQARAAAIALFLLVPLSPASVYVFSSVMGLLWLSTVPVTNATVAQIFGVAHLSMLSGFVFFSHQIGSFMGVWLGGYLYDKTGSYDVVWYIAIALGVFAALINLPIKEAAIARQAQPLRTADA
jgi:predicted MFS family arabinose efflux permease